jgi:hypothetical protein
MKQRYTVLLLMGITLSLTGLLVSGCGMQQAAPENTPLAKIWPTPDASSNIHATATPFPRVTIVPAPTATPEVIATTEVSATVPAPESQAAETRIEVLAAEVPLYASPDKNAEKVGTLKKGDIVTVISFDLAAGWAQVKTADGKTGWVTGDPSQARIITGGGSAKGQAVPASQKGTAAPSSVLDEGKYRMMNQVGNSGAVLLKLLKASADVTNQPGGGEVIGTLKQGESAPIYTIDASSMYIKIGMPDGKTGWVMLDGDGMHIDGGIDALSIEKTRLAPAQPAPASGLSGKLVIQSVAGGDFYLVNGDGSGFHRLSGGFDPVLSPDGAQVAFTRRSGTDNGSLWVINIDGSGERQVRGEINQARHPTWSPDGQQLAVTYQNGGRLEEKRECTNIAKLDENQPNIPWNVKNHSTHVDIRKGEPYLCWVNPADPHYALRMVTVNNGEYRDLPGNLYSFGPEWDPANSWRIVSTSSVGLMQLDVNRDAEWALTNQREDRTPAFSPDGRYIAVAFNNSNNWEIHRLNADGSGRMNLTKVPMSSMVEGYLWNSVAPAWSPDGSKIAFVTDRTGKWELWVMNADGSDQRPLLPETIQFQLNLKFNQVDERLVSWGK